MQKVDARSISSSAQEHLRQLAVKAVLDGKKQKEVAQSLELHRKPSVSGLKRIAFRAQEPSNRNGKAARKEENSCLGRLHKSPRRSLIIIRNNSNCLFTSGPGKRWGSSLDAALAYSCRFGL